MKTLAVYCGASHGVNPIYTDAARGLAAALVEHNIGLVYGGGKVGLMGVIADEVLRLGGEATGVIPKALVERAISGREIEVGVLDGPEPLASPAGEITFEGDWYDYETKYVPGRSQVQVPADIWLGKHVGTGLLAALGFQVLWAAVLLAACQGVLRLATRKVVVQGG